MTDMSRISERQFSRLVDALGPFERRPRLAVAVSGGADSLALAFLTKAWTAANGGRIDALTVDHRLRRGSAEEAAQVGQWMLAAGIDHHILVWQGDKPASGIQAAARAARYDLMADWCRRHGVLHLAVAHHLEDQAETYLLRAGAGSGIDGLAAMARISEHSALRLLRPLLGTPKARLQATLERAGHGWIEDPSNRDERFQRVRLRNQLPGLAGAGVTVRGLAAAAGRMGAARTALEDTAANLLARCCALYPAGYAIIDGDALAAAPEEVMRRALARVITCVGGRQYAPGSDGLDRLVAGFKGDPGNFSTTLGGCRLDAAGGRLLVCGETRGGSAGTDLDFGAPIIWDRRFAVNFDAPAERPAPTGWVLRRLGEDGWREIVARAPELRRSPIPHKARLTLPAFADDEGILMVPHLGFERDPGDLADLTSVRLRFSPPNGLAATGFFLANRDN